MSAVESATADLRRVLLTGGDPAGAGARLTAAAAALGALLPEDAPAGPELSVPARAAEPEATAVPTSLPAPTPDPPAEREPAGRRRSDQVTKRVTKSRRPIPLDLDTVRVERNPDPAGRTWRVLAGTAEDPILVGYVESARTVHGGRNSRRWSAVTAELLPITDRARNRTDALVALVDSYQRAAVARRR